MAHDLTKTKGRARLDQQQSGIEKGQEDGDRECGRDREWETIRESERVTVGRR